MQEKLDAAHRLLEAQEATNARWDEEQRKRDEEHRKGQEQLAEMTKLLTYLKKSDSRIAAYMEEEQPTTEELPAATQTIAPTDQPPKP
ncbi:hypothetical protein AALP_AAs59176U000100 [Arabis alpina]|uniref:Uncharacterized protein n=1 Tax=Arabis alpina TaxID=50452 RepID=A0A087FZM1_ARAAL|nr:hypothetical protein AALP_AAs59176U000100 [Arabis alpina]